MPQEVLWPCFTGEGPPAKIGPSPKKRWTIPKNALDLPQKCAGPSPVFDPTRPNKREVARKLLRQGRVGYITPANYTKDSRTFRLVCAIIDKIKADADLKFLARYK